MQLGSLSRPWSLKRKGQCSVGGGLWAEKEKAAGLGGYPLPDPEICVDWCVSLHLLFSFGYFEWFSLTLGAKEKRRQNPSERGVNVGDSWCARATMVRVVEHGRGLLMELKTTTVRSPRGNFNNATLTVSHEQKQWLTSVITHFASNKI